MLSCYVPYLKYVLRHKWYVFQECCKQGIYFRGIMHDLSKFMPDEICAYANHFYGGKATEKVGKNGYCKPTLTGDDAFDIAWLKHQHRNPHHWQYWVLKEDSGKVIAMPMPDVYAVEMVCDWLGAGAAQGKPRENLRGWYADNKAKIVLHNDTRKFVEELVERLTR